MAQLIKTDKNGTKYFVGMVECDRCQGRGEYWCGGMIDGRPMYAGVCFKCGGSGKMESKWVERTPEYQAKLDAKREAKNAKTRAEREAKENAMMLASMQERAEREAAEAARKAISQYVGTIGEKMQMKVVLEKRASYEAPKFGGYGTQTVWVYTFNANGNKLVWKTSGAGLEYWDEDGNFHGVDEGEELTIKFTVKGYDAYKGERQTEIQRVKRI